MKPKRGSLRQRGRDVWELRVYRGVDAESGRSRYATRTVHGSRRAALRELDALVAEVDNAATHAGTVAELLERWFASASPAWAATTAAHTRSIIDCHLILHLGHLPVAKVTTADIDDFYGFLLRRGGRDGGGLSAGTVRRIHAVLHRAMVQALLWGWIWINPAAEASPPKVRKTELRPPDPTQVAALLRHAQTTRPLLYVLLRLAATTGARRGQLLALRWRDIDLDRQTVAFTRALVMGRDGPVLAATKTDRTHQVQLDGHTAQTLADCHADAQARAHDAGATLTADGFVFTRDADASTPWLPNYVTHQFIATRKEAGLDHFRLHDLRHFMATQMLSAQVPLATVAQRLNHARISTTVSVYTHAIPAWDRPAAETLSNIIASSRLPARTDRSC